MPSPVMVRFWPTVAAHALPGYRGLRILTSAILTPGFTQTGPLLIALAWLTGAAVIAALLFCHNTRTAGLPRPHAHPDQPAEPAPAR